MNAICSSEVSPAADRGGLAARYRAFAAGASSRERAEAVSALARAYLHCELQPDLRRQSEIALAIVLDDPDVEPRRALAEAFASAAGAPKAIVLALARDVAEIARCVLALSPRLDDADLADLAAGGDAPAQLAIARRPGLGARAAEALAERGGRVAAAALIGNTQAELRRPQLWRLFERFRDDAAVRARLAERPGLPAPLRAALATTASDDLAALAASGWMAPARAERMADEGREQAFVRIASECSGPELAELVAWLRAEGRLTPALLLRALCSGDATLLTQGLSELSGLPSARAGALIGDGRGRGFGAIYRRARMPAAYEPVFRLAVGLLAREPSRRGLGVDYDLATRLVAAVEALAAPGLEATVAALWRLAAEAARESGRDSAEATRVDDEAFLPEPDPALRLDFAPINENHAPPQLEYIRLDHAAAA